MIKYLLGCASGHEFESWFRAGADFDAQSASGKVSCPFCGSLEVAKQPMAPSVVTKRAKSEHVSQEAFSAPAAVSGASATALHDALREFTQKVVANTEDVGPRFADEARKMHFGEIEERQIRGTSTAEEARELA
ncbi:MAG: DUF1178 family protein, partial [Hyphomicrobium sp.]